MYNWFFFIIYNYFQNRKNYDSLFHSVAVVAFAQVIHFCLFLLIIIKIIDFDLKAFGKEHSINKLFIFPFAFIWLYLVEKHFKKKVNNKNLNFSTKTYTLSEILLISTIFIFIPLVFLIRLSGGQIWK